jgi:predicted RNA-binding Zn-ribbon protein involved in translation (DUF1610 family)
MYDTRGGVLRGIPELRLSAEAGLHYHMPAFIYKCPNTGFRVQGWLAEMVPPDEGQTYETIECVACGRMHLINRSTGRTLGGD